MMKLPIREIIKQEYDVKIDKNEAMSNEYLIKQGDSIIFCLLYTSPSPRD